MNASKIRRAEKALQPFPQRLGLLLQQKNISQEQLGKELGKSRQAVSLYCNGAEPDYPTLVKIADYLGVTVDYLVGREDAPAHEAASIVEQTGLHEAAVDVLCRNKDDKNMSAFLSSFIMCDTIKDISLCYEIWAIRIKMLRMREDDSKYFDLVEMLNGARYGVIRSFEKFLSKMQDVGFSYKDQEVGNGKGEE